MEKRVIYILLPVMLYDRQKARHSGNTHSSDNLQGAWSSTYPFSIHVQFSGEGTEHMALSCAREGLDWIPDRVSSWGGWTNFGNGLPRQVVESLCPQRYLRDV